MEPCDHKRSGRLALKIVPFLLALAPALGAQTSTVEAKSSGELMREPTTVKTYYLKNVTQPNDASEILTALRNILIPNVKIYLVNNQNAVILEAPADQQALAQRLITDLDRPRKSYRLTYTITELDAGKRTGLRHVTMVVTSGQRGVLKQGDKVPLVTGSYDSGKQAVESQATYIDVGLNFDSTLEDTPGGLKLKSKVERSSVSDQKAMLGTQEPIIRQAVIEGVSSLTTGKPLMLGSMDLPDSTQQIQVEVEAEPVS